MAHAVTTSPHLRLVRSAQSGSKAMTAVYTVVYTESSVMAYMFASAVIDLSTMAAGDIIDIRIRKILVSGGAWVPHGALNYIGAMPAGHQTVFISPIPDTYGVEISMRQTLGVLKSCDVEIYDAKRLGS